MEDASDPKRVSTDGDGVTGPQVLRPGAGVSDERLVIRPASALGDHEPLRGELAAGEAEHEPRIRHVEINPAGSGDARLARGLLCAGGDGKQRHDQPHAEGDPGGGERGSRRPTQEVAADEASPGHPTIFALLGSFAWSLPTTRS